MSSVKFRDIKRYLFASLIVSLISALPLYFFQLNLTKMLDVFFDTAIQAGFSLLGFSVTALSMISLLSSKDWFSKFEESGLYARLINNFYVAISSFAIIAGLGLICKLASSGSSSDVFRDSTIFSSIMAAVIFVVFVFLFCFSILWIMNLMNILIKLLKATKE